MDANDALIIIGLFTLILIIIYYVFSDYVQFYSNFIGSWMLYPFAYFSIFESRVHYLYMVDGRYSTADALYYAQLYYMPIFVGFNLWLAWFLYKSDYITRFLFKMNLKELIHYQADYFHQSNPASRAIKAGFLTHEVRTKGPWARQKSEKEYVEALGLPTDLTEDDTDKIKTLQKALIKPLSAQVGDLFKGVTKMKRHEYLLAAVFLSFMEGNKDDDKKDGIGGGELIMDYINEHYLEPALNTKYTGKAKTSPPYFPLTLKQVMPIFKRNKKLINRFGTQHAFKSTILMRMLYEARGYGMLPPSAFLWLKTTDRNLWYALHQLGPFIQGEVIRTRRICAEAAGTHAHYKSEVLAGHRLDVPFIHSAAIGMVDDVAKKIL